MFEVQRMGVEYGIEVAFLHLADPELNPIENVWAVIKNIDIFSIRAIDFQDDDAASLLWVKDHIEYALGQITRNMWVGFEDSCIEAENMNMNSAEVEEAIDFGDESEEEIALFIGFYEKKKHSH